MRIVLQHRETGWYLSSRDAWVSNLRDAREFTGTSAAFHHQALHNIQLARIVVKFEGGMPDLVLSQPGETAIS